LEAGNTETGNIGNTGNIHDGLLHRQVSAPVTGSVSAKNENGGDKMKFGGDKKIFGTAT
jgi:hypothetical protein